MPSVFRYYVRVQTKEGLSGWQVFGPFDKKDAHVLRARHRRAGRKATVFRRK